MNREDRGPPIEVTILADGKPMEEFAAVGAEAQLPRQTTTYIEPLFDLPFEIQAIIDPDTRFEADFITLLILFDGVERDTPLIEKDEFTDDEPIMILCSNDCQGKPYCFPSINKHSRGSINNHSWGGFVVQIHHIVKGTIRTPGVNGVPDWHDSRFLDPERVPIWEFIFKYRRRATLPVRGLVTTPYTSCAPKQHPRLRSSRRQTRSDDDETNDEEPDDRDEEEDDIELQGFWIDIYLDGTRITAYDRRDVVEKSRIATRFVAVTGGLLHVAMTAERGAHFPIGSDVAVFEIFMDGQHRESAAIEQQSTVHSHAQEISSAYPTDLGHLAKSLCKDIFETGVTQSLYPPGTVVVEMYYMRRGKQPDEYHYLDKSERPARTFVFNCVDQVTQGRPIKPSGPRLGISTSISETLDGRTAGSTGMVSGDEENETSYSMSRLQSSEPPIQSSEDESTSSALPSRKRLRTPPPHSSPGRTHDGDNVDDFPQLSNVSSISSARFTELLRDITDPSSETAQLASPLKERVPTWETDEDVIQVRARSKHRRVEYRY